MNGIIAFFILVRHGINPFKATSKTVHLVRKRLTDKEKEYLITRAKNESTKEFLYYMRYEKAR